MKTDLQRNLLDKFPQFFTNDRKIYVGEGSMDEEVNELLNQEEIVLPIQFGFECGDGWYWLLNNLMNTIQSYCKNNKKPIINVTQIKEKFGGLRFYYDGGDNKIDGMVWLAEELSYHICETCGTTNHVGQTSTGWIYTICKECLGKNERANTLDWKENE